MVEAGEYGEGGHDGGDGAIVGGVRGVESDVDGGGARAGGAGCNCREAGGCQRHDGLSYDGGDCWYGGDVGC